MNLRGFRGTEAERVAYLAREGWIDSTLALIEAAALEYAVHPGTLHAAVIEAFLERSEAPLADIDVKGLVAGCAVRLRGRAS